MVFRDLGLQLHRPLRGLYAGLGRAPRRFLVLQFQIDFGQK